MNQTPNIIAALRAELESSPVAELPAILGQIEALRTETFVRLVSVAPRAATSEEDSEADRLLSVDEAAERLRQTPRWVRDHRNELPRVKLPGRTLRFSEKRLTAFIKRRGYGS